MSIENIIEIAETIAAGIKEHGSCVQLYGSWCDGFDEENRKKLAEQLRERGVETVKLFEYAELYLPVDMDSAEKEAIIAKNKKTAPVLFEKAAADYYNSKRNLAAMESFFEMIAHTAAKAMMEIFENQDDDSDDDDEETNSDNEDEDSDEE